MKRALGRQLRLGGGEAGFTLIELLVAMTMGVVVLGAVGSLVVSALKDQPKISQKAQDVSTARWVLERLTREIRNGVAVDPERATASEVSFRTLVRHSTCGGAGTLASSVPARECQVTYRCTTTKCSRIEANPGVYTGTETTIFEGIDDERVFCFVPSAEEDPTECGPAKEGTSPTYIGVTLKMPNPDGSASGGTTVSDGASLRNATLSN